MTDQETANATYREFNDGPVQAAQLLFARLVREEAIASKAPAALAANELVSRLSRSDRELLASMLEAERSGAIHDVLANLTWWLDTGRVRWSAGQQPMPAGLEGGLHCDFIGRLEGWEWPHPEATVRTPRMQKAPRQPAVPEGPFGMVGVAECLSNFLARPPGLGKREDAGVGEHVRAEVTTVQ